MGNTGQALSNLTQPYLASAIGTYFDNLERQPDGTMSHEYAPERLLAHAAAGAAIAYLSGNNAASGATGAVSGEAMAIIVHDQLYGNKPTDQLTTAEKESIRAIATLASGLAGALQGGSFESAATSAAAGYNAAVNNDVGVKTPSSKEWVINELQKAMNSGDVAAFDRVVSSNSDAYSDHENIDKWRRAAVANQKIAEEFAIYAQSTCVGISADACFKQFKDIRVDNANLFFSTFIPAERLAVLGFKLVRGVIVANRVVKTIEAVGASTNRFHHIFANPEHNLGGLVSKFGSEQAAFEAVQKAATDALYSGVLSSTKVIPPKRAASKSRINTSPAFSAGRVSLLKPSYAFALE